MTSGQSVCESGSTFHDFLRRYSVEDMRNALRKYDVEGKSAQCIKGSFRAFVFGLEAELVLQQAYDAQILTPPGSSPYIRNGRQVARLTLIGEAMDNPIVAESVEEVKRRLGENSEHPQRYYDDRVMADTIFIAVMRGEFNLL